MNLESAQHRSARHRSAPHRSAPHRSTPHRSGRRLSTTVLIVGAGPTGLALAATLAHLSVDAVIIDRSPQGANTSRAAVVHARTLDVLEPLGLADPLIARGLVVPTFGIRHRDRTLMTIDFGRISSPHRYALMVPQSTTEAVLANHLPPQRAVLRGRSIDSVTQDGADVRSVLIDAEGARTEIDSRWVVGCDGMHSKVRELAGIGFTGGQYAESFLLADVRMDWPIPRSEVELLLAPEGLVVVAPLPEDRFRIVATVPADIGGDPDLPTIQRLLDKRGPRRSAAAVHEVVWASRFTVHHRLAVGYRQGNVFLAGDAAHVHSPAGGQGMNLGIQDAVDLGRTLAAVESGQSSGEWANLDGYQARRRPQAERVVRLTDRMTKAATARRAPTRAIRNLLIGAAGRIPAVPLALAEELSGAALNWR